MNFRQPTSHLAAGAELGASRLQGDAIRALAAAQAAAARRFRYTLAIASALATAAGIVGGLYL